MPKTSFPLPAKKSPFHPPSLILPPPHDKSCCHRSRHLTKISRKTGYLEKTRVSPLHSQHPGLAAGPGPIDSRDRPGSNHLWKHWGRGGRVRSPSAERSMKVMTRRNPWRRGCALEWGWRPREVPRGQSCRMERRTASDRAMWGLQGWGELRERTGSSELECNQGNPRGKVSRLQ